MLVFSLQAAAADCLAWSSLKAEHQRAVYNSGMSTAVSFTAEQYAHMGEIGALDHLGRRIELIRGEIRQMSPVGPIHSDYIDFLMLWSVQVTEGSKFKVRIQSDVVTGLSTQPVPDLCWLNARRYVDRLPRPSDIQLLIEVADSSLRYDLGEKAELYAEAGVREYWVVDVSNRCLHRMSDPMPEGFAKRDRVVSPERPAPLCLPSATLDLKKLFDGLEEP